LEMIHEEAEIERKSISANDLDNVDNLITLPGENYPSSVFLIKTGLHQEPCCGTHLNNTRDIKDFVVVGLKTPSPGTRSVKCLTGDSATDARDLEDQIIKQVLELESGSAYKDDAKDVSKKISNLLKVISNQNFPYVSGLSLRSKLEELQQGVKTSTRSNIKEIGHDLVKVAVKDQETKSHFCHYLNLFGADKFNLTSALKLVPKHKPALLLVNVGKELKGKAVVPQDLVNEGLNAKNWIEIVSSKVGGKVSAPRGQDETVNCNLMGGKSSLSVEEIQELISCVTKYAETVIKN